MLIWTSIDPMIRVLSLVRFRQQSITLSVPKVHVLMPKPSPKPDNKQPGPQVPLQQPFNRVQQLPALNLPPSGVLHLWALIQRDANLWDHGGYFC